MDRPKSITRQLAAIAAAPVVAASSAVLLAICGLIDIHLFWPPTPITLPEAVVLRSGWEVLAQFRRGVDPNAPFPVRREVLDLQRPQLSAWEAAVGADRAEVIELLAREGAQLRPDIARAAVCLGKANDRDEAVDALVRLYQLDVSPPCDHGQ
jgi:hypothetical protein